MRTSSWGGRESRLRAKWHRKAYGPGRCANNSKIANAAARYKSLSRFLHRRVVVRGFRYFNGPPAIFLQLAQPVGLLAFGIPD